MNDWKMNVNMDEHDKTFWRKIKATGQGLEILVGNEDDRFSGTETQTNQTADTG